jgi:hypothetical protein
MNDVQMIEIQIEEAKEFLKQADALKRLRNSEDWKTVIEEGYFREHAIQLVSLKAAAAMDYSDKQASIMKGIDAIGELQQWLNGIFVMAEEARRSIDTGNETLDDIANEAEEVSAQ